MGFWCVKMTFFLESWWECSKGGGGGCGFYQAGKIIYQSFSYIYIYKRNHYYKHINFKLEQWYWSIKLDPTQFINFFLKKKKAK